MKNFKSLAIIFLVAVFMSSCGGLNKMLKDSGVVNYSVEPTVLEEHGGNINATITIQYPAKYFNKKAVMTLTPVIRYEGGETELEPLLLQGEDATENNKVIGFDNGGSATHEISFPYDATMAVSELHYVLTAVMGDKDADLGSVKLADGIVATAQMVDAKGKAILAPNKYKQIVAEAYQTDIKYVINRADVRRSEMGKEEVTGMNTTIKEADENERLELKGIEISAYASPDGELDLNTKLAGKRQKSAEKYLQGQLKKAKIEVIDSLMSTMSTPEDWDGFKAAVEASDIQDKEMILRVLSMHSDPVVREQEIKNLSAAYEVIADEILPALRRAKFTVNMDRIGFSDEELKTEWTGNPDTLGLEELLYAATLYKDLETKLAVYEKAVAVAPECGRAHNNKGVILFEMGKVDEAEACFAKAKEIKDHDIFNNNLGVIALYKDDVASAKEAFTASMGAGSDVNYNLGVVAIKEGDYDAAVNYFGSEPSVNAALAKYMSGDTDGAMQTVTAVECECPKKYYMTAVIAAKQDQSELVFTNLKTAAEKCKDPQKIKDKAKKDLAFAKYFEEEAFKAIVE